MVEIRAFEGTAEELSEFAVSTWKSSYTGTVPVPNWTADYFRWQLQADTTGDRRHLMAAYDGSKCAGIVLCAPYQFELEGRQIAGSQASWLSVHSDYRRQGIAGRLKKGAMQSSRDQGQQFQIGFVFHGAKQSIGPRFWLNKKRMTSVGQSIGSHLGFWARALDAQRLAEWSVDAKERLLAKISRPFVGPPKVSSVAGTVIREFREEDLPRCVELANQATQHCDFRLLWDTTTLKRHLEGFGQCLVCVQKDIIEGFVAYHSLVFSGLCDARVGIIDLVCVSQLNRSSSAALLDSVLVDLQQAGAIVALKLRCGDYPRSLFWRWGWSPAPAHSHTLFSWVNKPIVHAPIKHCHLLWR